MASCVFSSEEIVEEQIVAMLHDSNMDSHRQKLQFWADLDSVDIGGKFKSVLMKNRHLVTSLVESSIQVIETKP